MKPCLVSYSSYHPSQKTASFSLIYRVCVLHVSNVTGFVLTFINNEILPDPCDFWNIEEKRTKKWRRVNQFHFLVIKHYTLLKNAIFNQIPSTGKLIYIF